MPQHREAFWRFPGVGTGAWGALSVSLIPQCTYSLRPGHWGPTLLVTRPWVSHTVLCGPSCNIISWGESVFRALIPAPTPRPVESQSLGVGLSLCIEHAPWEILMGPEVRYCPQRSPLRSSGLSAWPHGSLPAPTHRLSYAKVKSGGSRSRWRSSCLCQAHGLEHHNSALWRERGGERKPLAGAGVCSVGDGESRPASATSSPSDVTFCY